MNENLTANERQDFASIVRKRRGRPWTLDDKERRRLVGLVKKATTGEHDADWAEVGMALATLLPPRMLNQVWKRLPRG